MKSLGIDVGSTTVKIVLIDESNNILFKRYERHMSNVFEKVKELIRDFNKEYSEKMYIAITGSGGMSLAEQLHIPFEQEVIACSKAVETIIPDTDVVIELGGEDAKITFYEGTVEQRMNGTCAGGTGAFIDQMALLLNTNAKGLNDAAKNYSTIYPIAARCGVFAKTDIQPLINEGASLEDLAASIFQAVVEQTITGLACGRVIRGNVAFLGGPLSFLPELRKRFETTLDLSENQVIFPDDAQYYVAIGAALLANEQITTGELLERLINTRQEKSISNKTLPALFESQKDYEDFKQRHSLHSVPKKELESAVGNCFLGIDAGSTTTKAALIDEDGCLLYTFYKNNKGNPVSTVKAMLKDLYSKMPSNLHITYTVTTGYGEKLIQSAFHADYGEIETVAHYTGAKAFLPDVDFILDIGGQDMKCIKIKNNAIYNIMLNEACSSGCGSFLESFAKSVDLTTKEFAQKAIEAKNPVDLGTRCTVFMNSKVKQAQKEGATLGDISAGLSYSIIKNALYKVIKLRDVSDAGKNIVVQGGTFLNDAVLRSMEQILDTQVIRPDIAGTMGAYGAALIGKERFNQAVAAGKANVKSTLLSCDELDSFTMSSEHTRCEKCTNHCQLTINTFSDGNKLVTGNRCEKGVGKALSDINKYNLFAYKYKRIFSYTPIQEKDAKNGVIGLPRVLNMYENYPFWFTFFTKLSFRVVLSPPSTKKIYSKGIDTIASDTVCYPAKLVHGHLSWLIEHGVKRIFYPSLNYERIEDDSANNHFNCPVVAMYPEVIAGNMDDTISESSVEFLHPFLPYFDDKRMVQRLYDEFKNLGISKSEIQSAYEEARKEDDCFKQDVIHKADEIIDYVNKNDLNAIVLAGRPYHLDPEINHGIDQMITSYGFAVLTEDSVAHRGSLKRPIRVLDQWMYHSRLYKAADFCGEHDNMDLIQLNSFGCGLDAVTTDQVEEILTAKGKLYTLLKIDQGGNLGAARIRIRSLKAAIEERKSHNRWQQKNLEPFSRVTYTKKMREDYTLIIPQMAPMHFDLFEAALKNAGYKAVVLPSVDKQAVDVGLKYINNDACYPTIVSLGQIIHALQSGAYDVNKTAVIMTQTGGGCRASNYVPMLRKALKEIHMEQVPVVSINWSSGMEKNPGLKITPKLLYSLFFGLLYGDLFMNLTNATRPYEKEPGSVDRLYRKWNEIVKENIKHPSRSVFKKNVRDIISSFDTISLNEDVVKPKIGVVGEILVKYHPNANNNIVDIIEQEGGQAIVPDLFAFFLMGLENSKFNHDNMTGSYAMYILSKIGIKSAYLFRKFIDDAMSDSKRFHPSLHIDKVAEKAQRITSLGTQCGESWLLPGEMMELMDDGVENILCLQPFGCLPNHIIGKGMIKPMRKYNPKANIVAIDYDPGASEVNQLNRIKLMIATAKKNLQDKQSVEGKDGINKDNSKATSKSVCETAEKSPDKSVAAIVACKS